jgi:hypothetical protein
MTDQSLTIDPASWPTVMAGLTSAEQLFAVYRARGFSIGEATLAAGYAAGTAQQANKTGGKVAGRPRVAEAIRALKAHHAAQHRETIYARAE